MPRRSTGEYPPNWKEIAKGIKDTCGWQCVRCNHPHAPQDGYTLTIHHLDLNPANNAWWNLAPLCQRCHLTIQGKVVMERAWFLPHSEWFKPYAAGFYAAQRGLPTDREFVMDNVDVLLALGQGLDEEDEAVAALADYWPEMPDLPDGVDHFAHHPVAGGHADAR